MDREAAAVYIAVVMDLDAIITRRMHCWRAGAIQLRSGHEI